MYKTNTVTIGDHKYEMSDWSVFKTMKYQLTVLNKVEKALPSLVNGTSGDPTGEEISRAVSSVIGHLDEHALESFLKDIFEGVSRVGVGPVDIATMFAGGSTLSMYKLVYEVFKWQYRDFFSALQGDKNILNKLMSKVVK